MPRPPISHEQMQARRATNRKVLTFGCLPLIVLFVIVIVVVSVTGSGDSKNDSKPTPDYSAAESAAGIPPEPSAKTRTAYLADLDAIDPDIVHGEGDKAVDRGRDECSSIKQKLSRTRLVDLANQRFTSPDHPEGHGTATAARILDVVHKRLCPSY